MNKLYDQDFFGWTQDQADALRRRSVNELDWDNLIEEVESMGRQERNELRNRLSVLMAHILKTRLQPERESRSWRLTIQEQRARARDILAENPSLKPGLTETIEAAYRYARPAAARRMKISVRHIPIQNPFSWDDLMAGSDDDEAD